jgi:hypothetical protein
VLVQAGAFGEHEFTEVDVEDTAEGRRVHDRHFAVSLTPGTGIRLRAGLRRFARTPDLQGALDLL